MKLLLLISALLFGQSVFAVQWLKEIHEPVLSIKRIENGQQAAQFDFRRDDTTIRMDYSNSLKVISKQFFPVSQLHNNLLILQSGNDAIPSPLAEQIYHFLIPSHDPIRQFENSHAADEYAGEGKEKRSPREYMPAAKKSLTQLAINTPCPEAELPIPPSYGVGNAGGGGAQVTPESTGVAVDKKKKVSAAKARRKLGGPLEIATTHQNGSVNPAIVQWVESWLRTRGSGQRLNIYHPVKKILNSGNRAPVREESIRRAIYEEGWLPYLRGENASTAGGAKPQNTTPGVGTPDSVLSSLDTPVCVFSPDSARTPGESRDPRPQSSGFKNHIDPERIEENADFSCFPEFDERDWKDLEQAFKSYDWSENSEH